MRTTFVSRQSNETSYPKGMTFVIEIIRPRDSTA